MAVDSYRLVPLVAGAATLVIAAAILAAGPRRGLNRALAVVLAARGMTLGLPQVSTDPSWGRFALTLQPAFALILVPAVAYCILALGGDAAKARARGWLAVAAGVLLVGLYVAHPPLMHTLEEGPASMGALNAGAGLRYVDFGPLSALVGTAWVLIGILALRAAVAYRAKAREPAARPLLVLTGGLLVGVLFDGASRAATLADLLDAPGGFPWLPWGWGLMVLPIFGLVPGALAAGVLAANRSLDPRPLHSLEGILLGISAFAVLTGFVRLALPPSSDIGSHPLMIVFLGAWRLAMPVLLAFALLQTPQATPTADPQASGSILP